MNKTSYISSICFWVFITAYVLLICTFNDAYYICFLPSCIAGVVSALVLPPIIRKRKNNLKILFLSSTALHIVGVGVSLFIANFTRFAHHFTYLTLKGYIIFIILPAILSLVATLVQQYLMFRTQEVKDFLYNHEIIKVALIIVLVLAVVLVLIVRPFSRIMVILMPF